MGNINIKSTSVEQIRKQIDEILTNEFLEELVNGDSASLILASTIGIQNDGIVYGRPSVISDSLCSLLEDKGLVTCLNNALSIHLMGKISFTEKSEA